MSALEQVLRSDRALASLEETLIRRARDLHRLGFLPKNITPSQMNAVGEILRTAPGFPDALEAADRWMNDQLKKLKEEEARKSKARSWLTPPEAGAGEDSLGGELLAWLREERYLGGKPAADLDRLAALRRFWERFHGFYRYQNEIQEEMPLAALDLQKKGDEPE